MSEVPYTWPTLTLIQDGEAVKGRVPNRVTQQLAQRTEYLKQIVDNIEAGSTLWMYNQPISSEVSAGDAVYYDNGQAKFRPARAAVTQETTGGYTTNPSTFAQGIVHTKVTSTSAHIILRGYSADLKTIIGKDPGDYYLSGSVAGDVVAERPGVAMYVCTITDNGVFVNPVVRDILEDHTHYRFELAQLASGVTVTDNGDGTKTLSGGDSDSEGWLPADHAVFDSNAPSGAVFGYNISANVKLQGAWPPQPMENVYLEWDGVGVDSSSYIIDENGLWWTTNCTNHVLPWEVMSYSSSSSSSTAVNACATYPKKLILWMTKLVSATNLSVVSTLDAEDGSPITVVDCDDTEHISGVNPGAGGLSLQFTMPWSQTTGVTGSSVVKDITGNGVMQVGNVVEGIKVGDGLTISGGTALASGATAGTPTLSWQDPASLTRQLDVQIADLDRATEDLLSDVPVIGFPDDVANSVILKVRIPNLNMTTPKVKLVVWATVSAAGTPPDLSFDYKVIPVRTTPGGSIPAWTSGTDLNTSQVFSASGEYVEVESDQVTIAVTGEDMVLFRLTRSSAGGFSNMLYLSNIYAELVETG
jgi:hypothetical protein